MQKTTALRLSAFGVLLGFTALCLAPLMLYAHEVLAQTATAAPAAAAPVAAAPTVAPAVAPAAAPVPVVMQAWWQALLLPVLTVIGLFVAGFLAAGLRKLTQLIEAKWSIDIPDTMENMMQEKARWAVAWAEEQAEKRLLHGDGKKTEGAEKLTQVVDLLEEFAKQLGYDEEWRRDRIEKLAEGVLHLERGATVGSTGVRSIQLTEKVG